MTNGEFRVVGAKILEEPCLVICLLSALASVRKDIIDERGGPPVPDDQSVESLSEYTEQCAEALSEVRSAFSEILTTINVLYIPVNDRRLSSLWRSGMNYFQRSSYRFYRNYFVIKAFYNELRADSAQASIARLASPDMHDQLQTTMKELISPSVSAFLSQLCAFHKNMSPRWHGAVIWEQRNTLSSILNLYVQEKVTSLIAGRPGPDCFQIWCERLRYAIQFNLHVLTGRLNFYKGRPYDCNTVATRDSLDRFYATMSYSFPHQLPLVNYEDMDLEDPEYWPSDDEEKMDQATRDDVYAFMLLVNRKTAELSSSAAS